MEYKKSVTLILVLRIVFIVITSFVLGLIIYLDQKLYTKFVLIVLIIIQIGLLIKSFNKINKELILFLESINVKDSAYRFSTNLRGNFVELAKILNNTASLINDIRIEKEKQYQFLQFVVENINIALIAFDENHEIQLSNSALASLVRKNKIRTLNELDELNPEFVSKVLSSNLNEGFRIKVSQSNIFNELFVQKHLIKINSKNLYLVSLQNITAELDKKELESWQRLIRVLTHEIMNSITPIINLTYAIRRSLNEEKKTFSDSLIIDEAIEDIELIEKRSKSLIQFVENYKKLIRVGELSLSKVDISGLMHNVVGIFKEDFSINNITTNFDIKENIYLEADEKLLEQAVVNLLKNAIEATESVDYRTICVKLERSSDNIVISIKDSGKGIAPEKIQDVFTPFYTTKESGTGIGLSLVKQIISLHKGIVAVQSEVNTETVFCIQL